MKRSAVTLTLTVALLAASAQAATQAALDAANNLDAHAQAMIERMGPPAGSDAVKMVDARPALRKQAATVGYAEIKSSDYNFEWMLFSGGW